MSFYSTLEMKRIEMHLQHIDSVNSIYSSIKERREKHYFINVTTHIGF